MTWVTSRVEYTGMAYNRWDIKRGTQFEVSTVAEAERLVADGRADFGKVKPDKLGRPHEKSPMRLCCGGSRNALATRSLRKAARTLTFRPSSAARIAAPGPLMVGWGREEA